MNVPVATIKANLNLRTDFDATVNYLRSFISTIDHETRNVSQVEAKASRGKKGGKVNPKSKGKKNHKARNSTDDKSLDRYYERDEWFKLDPAVRAKIIKARNKRKLSKVSVSKEEESANEESDVEDELPSGSTSQRKSTMHVSWAKKLKKANAKK
jgi:hypothetical protein